jgi:hypothetical protein
LYWQTVEQQFIPALAIASAVSGYFEKNKRVKFMKDKSIFLPFIFLFIFLCGIGEYIYDQRVCNPEWRTIEDNLIFIQNPNSIKNIKLIPVNSDHSHNLINDTLVITDSSTIETFRILLCSWYNGEWQHPTSAWDARVQITMVNSKTLDFIVSKINNDLDEGMTHIYYGSKHCHDHKPTCSLKLGKYLETLTNYEIKNSH